MTTKEVAKSPLLTDLPLILLGFFTTVFAILIAVSVTQMPVIAVPIGVLFGIWALEREFPVRENALKMAPEYAWYDYVMFGPAAAVLMLLVICGYILVVSFWLAWNFVADTLSQ